MFLVDLFGFVFNRQVQNLPVYNFKIINNHVMKKIVASLVLFFAIASPVMTQTLVSAEVQKKSFLNISGSTNFITFKLYQNAETLSKGKLNVATTQSQNKVFLSQNQLSVVVKNFDSNNFMALNEFFKLLKSDTYPILQVQINFFDLQPITEKGLYYMGNASISITITGITKQYLIPISLSSNGDLYVVNGTKKLNVHDFGLNPQPKIMGLMKVSEWINIDFHIIYKIPGDNDFVKL